VNCPNCHRIFKEYGTGIEVQTVYEELLQVPDMGDEIRAEVTVHDPCGIRFVPDVQRSARDLLQRQGITIREMKHKQERTFCCGEGGSAGFVRPDFAKKWTRKRVVEAGTNPIISYCAGCTHFLGQSAITHHLLDLLFFPEAVMAGKQKVSKTPVIYWNRYRLKHALQKQLQGGVSGSRQQLKQ